MPSASHDVVVDVPNPSIGQAEPGRETALKYFECTYK